MSIIVVCPGCGKRFKVSDRFAGKTGPCPRCKQPIKVLAKAEEVIIHEPDHFEQGGRGLDGQLVTKPIAREDTNFNLFLAAVFPGGALAIFALALWAGKMGLLKDNPFLSALVLTLLSPLLAWAAYSFLYNDELEPYKGISLIIRATICGLIYALLWGVFAYPAESILSGEVWNWIFVASPFFIAGAISASLTLDLELGNAFFHYSFYLITTIILRWAAGLDWIWNVKY